MRSLFSTLLALGAGFFAACYAEREPPPNFRYACDGDGDCLDGQTCNDGLCETPCTAETFADVCTRGEALCLNGVCTSTCEVGSGTCPGTQECVDLGIDLGGGGGGFFGGGSDAVIGVCMRECDEDSCPAGNLCLEGFCVAQCMTSDECTSGTSCIGGLCLPDLGTSGDASDATGDVTAATFTGGTDATTSDATTSDATTSDATTGDATTGAT